MAMAVEVASRSNCVKSHVGALILKDDRVRATGYNGTIYTYPDCFDGGCPRCKDRSKGRGQELDRCVCVHAEENALVSAARYGIEVEDTLCYVTHEPCLGCTKLLIQAGLREVVYLLDYEYPTTTDQNESRKSMRDHSRAKGRTLFTQFDPAIPAVREWQSRIESMKERSLQYATARGIFTN